MTPGLTCSQDDSPHQLEDGHPASFQDMDDTNEYYFIGGDVTRSNPPVTGWVRNALAVQQKIFNATCHVLGELLEADGVLKGLIPQVHLMFDGFIAWPADADLDRGLVGKLWRECAMELYVAQSGAHDRYAQAPIRVNEEHRHAELGLLHIAAVVARALREPRLLRHNGTAILNNSIIKKPRVSSIYRMRGRTIERRWIERVVGATLVTDCLDVGHASYVEELD